MRKVTHKHLSNNAWRQSFSISYEVGNEEVCIFCTLGIKFGTTAVAKLEK